MARRAGTKTIATPARRAAGCKQKPQPAARRAVSIRPGARCPRCGKGTLAYNGVVQLVCTACGHVAESGAFS